MARPPKPSGVPCPFTVVIDTRESRPYTFEAIRADVSRGGDLMAVPTVRLCLTDGDYSVFSLPGVAVERKSLADLFGSVARRDNFVSRLERLSALRHAAVVVEAEISEIMTRPPAFTRLRPKSLMRTILAWQMRYPVRWWFLTGRGAAEVWTFRILERYYREHKGDVEEAVFRTSEGGRIPSRPIEGVGEFAAQYEEGCPPEVPSIDWGGRLWPVACPRCSHAIDGADSHSNLGEPAAHAAIPDAPRVVPPTSVPGHDPEAGPATAEHADQ